ncbi:MAG: magnesium transporter [Planctomycetota bacterium]
MRHRLIVPEILELLSDGRQEDLVRVLGDLHPHDAADMLSGLEPDEINRVMTLLPVEMESDVFEYFEPDLQETIVLGSGRPRLKALLAAMASDDRAEFMDRLEPRVREQMLPLLTQAVRQDLVRRERYDDDQVGAILSTDFLVLDPELTAREAIEEIRRQEPSKETIYYSFVVDAQGVLLGFVSLRKLIMAPAERRVSEIVNRGVVSVRATDDQEEAAHKVREYDLLAIPVTDDQDRLLGIFTHDDAADILEEEAEEDIEMMAGITAEDRPESYLEGSVLGQFRRRVPILTILAVSFVAIGKVVHEFEDVARGVVYALLPMILATGGNVGNQTSTAVILGLRHDLTPSALGRVLWKELRIGLCLAGVLSVIAGSEAYLLHNPGADLYGPLATCGAVTLAMAMHVVTAALLGAVIPLGVAAAGRDPSMVAHPALATLADLSGALIYFLTVATLLQPTV